MTHVFHRNCGAPPPTAVQGDGCYIIDSEGKRYLDASGGAAVSCLGHSHPRVIQAMQDQMDALSFAHTGFFTNKPLEDLADFLISRAPDGLDYAYFVSGGSAAIETALKLAYQYFWEKGEGHRHRYIARRQSYHGNTMGALAVGGNMWRREQFAPIQFMTDKTKEAASLLARQMTEREMQILGALCRGLSNKEIARELRISFFTVQDHIKSVYRKLRISGRVELCNFLRA
mgnify:CR=1 FL=1